MSLICQNIFALGLDFAKIFEHARVVFNRISARMLSLYSLYKDVKKCLLRPSFELNYDTSREKTNVELCIVCT